MLTAEPTLSAEDVIARLGLVPHPEGGHYGETFRDEGTDGARPASTAIYYLLSAGERSAWHRVDAAEVWHHYAGAPLRLLVSEDGRTAREHRLGADLLAGERPQDVVPAGWWQSAEPVGSGWALVGCTVAPGFRFEGFELAPAGFAPVVGG